MRLPSWVWHLSTAIFFFFFTIFYFIFKKSKLLDILLQLCINAARWVDTGSTSLYLVGYTTSCKKTTMGRSDHCRQLKRVFTYYWFDAQHFCLWFAFAELSVAFQHCEYVVRSKKELPLFTINHQHSDALPGLCLTSNVTHSQIDLQIL